MAGVGYTNYGGRLGALASRLGIRKPFLAYERLEINAALRAPQYQSTLAGVVRHEGKHMALANNHINLKQLQYSRIPGVRGVAAWFDEGLAYGAEMGTGFAPYRAFSSMTATEKAHFWGAVGFGGVVAGGTVYIAQ